MGSVAEPPDRSESQRTNPLLAQERFFGRLRDRGHQILESDEGAEIVRFKRELVLSLFLKCGNFWSEIEAMRQRWQIEASEQLVPADLHGPYPVDPEGWDESWQWMTEINDIIDRVIPPRYVRALVEWNAFIARCILYDPPATALVEFAYFAGPHPVAPYPAPREAQKAMSERGVRLMMVAPPIESLADPSEARQIEAWLYRTMMQRIGERYLEPLGLDIWELYREVWESSPDVRAELVEMQKQNTSKLYIDVSETTTENDVRNAFRLIRQTQSAGNKGGKPKLDPLVAIQCAVLYDRENGPDPADGRSKKWTYPSLKKQYGLRSDRAAKYHIERGREILAKKKTM
jgi:hypothetical protein